MGGLHFKWLKNIKRALYEIQILLLMDKVLLEHSHSYLFIFYLWLLHAATAELRSYNRDQMACTAENLPSGLLEKGHLEKLADPCSK